MEGLPKGDGRSGPNDRRPTAGSAPVLDDGRSGPAGQGQDSEGRDGKGAALPAGRAAPKSRGVRSDGVRPRQGIQAMMSSTRRSRTSRVIMESIAWRRRVVSSKATRVSRKAPAPAILIS